MLTRAQVLQHLGNSLRVQALYQGPGEGFGDFFNLHPEDRRTISPDGEISDRSGYLEPPPRGSIIRVIQHDGRRCWDLEFGSGAH